MHSKHRSDFDNLADRLLSVVRKRPVVFVMNPGNWGDALIREGTELFLRYYEIDYVKIHLKDFERQRIDIVSLKR